MLGQIGRQRLMLMGAVAAVLLVALAAVALRGGNETMGFLYTDLDPSAAQSISDKLKAQNVPYQLSADGSSIMAPESKLAELRMSMAGEKLGGAIGYDLLDKEEPFGVSASRAKLNETRAIEGELARSIETLSMVTRARVHLVRPEREMFATETTRASAAVTVKTKGRLPAETVQAIRYLVSSAVPSLAPEAVSIVDQSGALLARAGEAGAGGGGSGDDRQAEVEAKLRDEIEALLQPIVGEGKVRAEVSADIDRDQTQEESDVYDPDKQVVAHQISVSTKDQKSATEAGAQGSGVARQLPDAQAQPTPPGTPPGSNEASDQTSEDTTYENSKTHSIVTRGPGRIKRLTVAVMIDGGAKGLPAPQVQRLTRLVENAVGADTARGDSVVIESMPFAGDATLKDQEPGLLSKLPTGRLVGLGELLLIAGVGLVAMRMLKPKPIEAAGPLAETLLAGQAAAAGGADAQMLPGGAGPAGALENHADGLDDDIDLAQVEGRLKASTLRKVGDAITASPPEAAAVIRQWMNA